MARWNRSRTESRGPRSQEDANTLPELREFRPARCEVCSAGRASGLKCRLFVNGAVGTATLQRQALKYQPSSQLAASFVYQVFVFFTSVLLKWLICRIFHGVDLQKASERSHGISSVGFYQRCKITLPLLIL